MRTPSELGIKKGTTVPPKGGWKASTYYIVEVAFSSCNVIFKTLFYSGFLVEGEPSAFNGILSTQSDAHRLKDTYYLKAVEELEIDLSYPSPAKSKLPFSTVNEILMTDTEIEESALATNELANDISKCVDYVPWHINWITRSSAGVVQAWEPDNTCIYEGTALNAACRALKLNTYNG